VFWKRKKSVQLEQGEAYRPLVQIDGSACLHASPLAASCKACADVCLSKAIVLNDEMLGLDEEACIGCGLCQAVCPQAAISIDTEIPIKGEKALLVCEKSNAAYGQARIVCIHQVGFNKLAELYLKGVRTLYVNSADCDACYAPDITLSDVINKFNILAISRELKPVVQLIANKDP